MKTLLQQFQEYNEKVTSTSSKDVLAAYQSLSALEAKLSKADKFEDLYRRMRNCAAGYSNQCDENGTTRKLDKEFLQIESEARNG